MLYSNQYISLIAELQSIHEFNQTKYNPGDKGNFKIVFKNKGLLNASNVKISLTPLSANLTIPIQQYIFSAINSFASDSVAFNFTVSGSVTVNTAIPAELKIMNDTSVIFSKRINVLIGNGNMVVNDNAEGSFSNWVTNEGWGITSQQSNSPTHSFTDSPGGQYQINANNSITMANVMNVNSAQVILLQYSHKYSVEEYYDFCIAEVSNVNDTSWQPVRS